MNDKPRVLYVDDEEGNLTAFKYQFEQWYEVCPAKSGEEALRLLEEARIQVVIADQRMPGMTGIELLERVATARPQAARLILTGYSDIDVVIEAVNKGRIAHYLQKPWDETTVRLAVDHALEASRLEAKLRQKEHIIESASSAIATADLDGQMTSGNPVFMRMWGFESTDEFVGRPFSELWLLGDRLDKTMDDLLAEGRWTDEISARRKDGSTFDVQISAALVRDEHGDPIGLMSSSVDVTQRKRNDLLQAAQLRLINYATDHSVPRLLQKFLDEAETLTESNAGFFHFVEDDQETLRLQAWSTKTLGEMCTAEGAGAHYPISQAGVWIDCVHQRQPVIHNDYAGLPHKKGLPDGHAPIVRELVVPVFRGDRIRAVLGVGNKQTDYDEADVAIVQRMADMAWEIVDRKLAREALEASEERYRRLIELSPDAIMVSDTEGRMMLCNEQFVRIHGLASSEDAIGKDVRELTASEDRERAVANLRRVVGGEGVPNIEYAMLRADGSRFPAEVTASLIRHSDGRPQAIMAISRDITERKRRREELENALAQVRELKERAEAENVMLRQEVAQSHIHGNIIGRSRAMKSVLAQTEQVAVTDSTVLVLGETGTGKELLARALHAMSPRKDRSLVSINCAAMPATLVEGELFGREKGAFTGAFARQPGRFEVADGSTLFLDEVGELSPEIQVKLLRVLQEGELQRLGSSDTIKVDVRLVAATNRDLGKEVAEGRFRQDLFYRLNVFPIEIPPLRERPEDIPPLVWAFVAELNQHMGKRIDSIPKKTMDALARHLWPGNVRELRNVIERSMILCDGSSLRIELPKTAVADTQRKSLTLAELERRHIIDVMEKTGWRVRGKMGAAEILGVKPNTLDSRMLKLGIARPAIKS